MSAFHLTQRDCVEWLGTLDDESVDLVITDPAYESLEKHRAKGTTTRLKQSSASSNEWFPIFPNARFGELFRELYRVLKQDRHFYMFCDAETMFVVKPLAEEVGFRWWNNIIWDKELMGMGYHYRKRHEYILFFEKGKRKLNDLGVADVIRAKRVRGAYPTEKPVYVNTVLVTQSSRPGEVVIDPFMGSASAGVAAVSSGRHFLGCDVKPESLRLAESRLIDAGGEPSGDCTTAYCADNRFWRDSAEKEIET